MHSLTNLIRSFYVDDIKEIGSMCFVCGMRRCTSADLVLMILDLFCYHKIWPIESREYADIVIIRSRIDAKVRLYWLFYCHCIIGCCLLSRDNLVHINIALLQTLG